MVLPAKGHHGKPSVSPGTDSNPLIRKASNADCPPGSLAFTVIVASPRPAANNTKVFVRNDTTSTTLGAELSAEYFRGSPSGSLNSSTMSATTVSPKSSVSGMIAVGSLDVD